MFPQDDSDPSHINRSSFGHASRGQQRHTGALAPVRGEDGAWERQIARLRGDARLDEYLLPGYHNLARAPFLVHRSLLEEHLLFIGGTGAGKTSLGLLPLLIQLIRQQSAPALRRAVSFYAALVIVDCKGDMALFETARLEAARTGRTFRFFTNELEQTTFPYAPLSQLQSPYVSVAQTAQSFQDAVGLNHGLGYGRSYYTRRGLRFLTEVLSRYAITTFADLFAVCNTLAQGHEREEVFEVIAVLEGLAAIQQLNVASPASIDLRRAIRDKEVVYFWLPARKESQTVNTIAKLVLFDLFQAADPHFPCYAIIDEFARCVGDTLTVILEQSRSLGLSLALSTQTLSSLKYNDTDLIETVWSNTHYRQIFDVTHPDTAFFLEKALGAITYLRKSPTHWVPVPLLALGGTVFSELNADPFLSLLSVTRDHGLTQARGAPVPLRMQHCLPLAEYQRRKNAPWPDRAAWPGTLQATKPALLPPPALSPAAYTPRTGRRAKSAPLALPSNNAAEDATGSEAAQVASELTDGLQKILDKTRPRRKEPGA